MNAAFLGKDLVRRFTPTPFSTRLRLMAHTIGLKTNSASLLERARLTFTCHNEDCCPPEFVWNIIVDSSSELALPWPEQVAFSDAGLRYINLGQRSFVAIDLHAREAVGFLSNELASDPGGVRCPFFSDFFDLCSPSLGLVGLGAASVADARRCLVVLGPPQGGKTTSAYLATTLGLRFFADQTVFLESTADGLLAWGDPWPAMFRWDTVQRFPDLHARARPYHWQDLCFAQIDRRVPNAEKADAAAPAACLFLERYASDKPRLVPLGQSAAKRGLLAALPFTDDEAFDPLREAIVGALARLPAYRLLYGEDPHDAACIYRELLRAP